MNAEYGCFEMQQIDGTFDGIFDNKFKLNLSMIFEYLYTKVVAAYVGKIIFTDDHFGNIAYINVDYVRAYHLICNGCKYDFYMPSKKMVQFIDLERYIFNYTSYDIYTNTALKSIKLNDDGSLNDINDQIKNTYLKNNFILIKVWKHYLAKK